MEGSLVCSLRPPYRFQSEAVRPVRWVQETGHELHAWPESEKNRYAEEHREGWGTFTDRLAKLLAERPRG